MSSKLPSFQFYPGDWRKDPGVQALSYHDRGVWFELLLLMFESSERGKLLLSGKVFPEDALARLLGVDKQSLTNTLTNLLTYGVAGRDLETGALISRRMIRDEEIRKMKVEAGKLGGNPQLLAKKQRVDNQVVNHTDNHGSNQKETTQDKQKMGSSSSSSTSVIVGDKSPENPIEPKVKNTRFTPPTIDEIRFECARIGLHESEGIKFLNYYGSIGWIVGKSRAPMKNWRQALTGWKIRNEEQSGQLALNGSKTQVVGKMTDREMLLAAL